MSDANYHLLWMQRLAFQKSKESNCSRLQVGAAIYTPEGSYLTASNFNQLAPCEHSDDTPCRYAVHAEINLLSILTNKIRYHREWQLPTRIYTTHAPCIVCAQALYQAGFRSFHWTLLFRDMSGPTWLEMHPDVTVAQESRLL